VIASWLAALRAVWEQNRDGIIVALVVAAVQVATLVAAYF
jgi:hypothetical protein